MPRYALELAALAMLFLESATIRQRPDYVHDRTAGQGKVWLAWAPSERERFLFGYLQGYNAGFASGCRKYFDANPPVSINLKDSPLQACMLQRPQYSKDIKEYTSQITSYYQEFPGDKDVPIVWLLQAFSDSENKTLQEIHKAWSEGHSHP